MNTSIHRTTTTATTSDEILEAQVTQLWGDNPIAHANACEGAMTFPVGEGEIEIARWVSGELRVTPPPGATVFVDQFMQTSEPFVLHAGHSADVTAGPHTFRISVGVREERPSRNVAAAVLEDTGLRTVVGSGVFHAALFAAFAFFMPAMSQADDLSIDRDQMLNLKAYLQASAEREMPQPDAAGDGAASGGDASGPKAQGEEGKTGGPQQTAAHARITVQGDERPEDVKLARERALRDAANFGMIGLLATTQADPNAPVVPWGSIPAGSDRESHMGDMFSGDPGDVFGTGWGLSGNGEGGGGSGQGVGLGGIGGLGSCLGANCTGGHGGIGHGHGPSAGAHHPHGPALHWKGDVKSNGRIDPAVIQRIVRLNSGRFIGCYKDGLRTNPSLEGRVAVSFVIGRDGTVALVKDTSGSDLPDANVRACVVRSFYNLSFPAPDSGIVSVTYPFTFTPE
jgi:hypothetical protein